MFFMYQNIFSLKTPREEVEHEGILVIIKKLA
jgi:hypothetical protein